MASRKKLQKELGAIPEEENVAIVPTESLPKTHLEMKEHKLVSKVKREMTPAQKINMAKMIEANKSRFENIRKAKVDAAEAAEKAKKDDIEAKLKAGTHVRVKIIPKTKRVRSALVSTSCVKKEVVEAPPVSEEESEESSVEYQASSKPVKVKKVRPPTPVETTTATDTETEPDESYKNTKRKVRREIKKNVRALKEIDEVMNHAPSNPYLSYLTGKWK
jgi:hypothetical protein